MFDAHALEGTDRMKGLNGTRREDLVWQRRTLGPTELADKRAVVVGGTGGIGQAIARELAEHGAQVTVVGRTFRDSGVAGLDFIAADLSSLVEARRLARELAAESLDLLVFTTGIIAAKRREVTVEGLERDLAVSYLNRYVMLREMAPRLGTARGADAPTARAFVWGMPGTNQRANADDLNAERDYAQMAVHSNTVAGNEALVLDAATRYPDIDVFGMNPGLMRSGIRSNALGEDSMGLKLAEAVIGTFFQSVETYAKAIVPLLVAPELERRSGAMFDRRGDAIHPSVQFADEAEVRGLMSASETLVQRALRATATASAAA